ncbi:tetratricopeptide repeat protein [Ekhidna sp.]|uniref:tetratricopeptide repeat protein n=1 Tax=Ekhidna sp. TaxID=2608089 RepID=UPI003CCBAF90
MKKILFLILGLITYSLSAQNSFSSNDFAGLEAFEEFQARKYQSVIGGLKSQPQRSNGEEILLLLSELKTGKRDASKIEAWYHQNENHPIKPFVAYHLGEFYFYQKDSLKSKEYLSSITASELSTQDKASYGYIYGLHQLAGGNYKNAKGLFQFARKNGFSNTAALDYYEAYASYHLDDWERALEGFEKSSSTNEYGTSSKFFIAKIQLENGQLDQVIELAQGELSEEASITNSGFYQIIGEAYALKNNTQKADAYFERAIQLHPGRPTSALYYQAGVSKFKIGNEDKAISYLTKAGLQGGEYAQLSAFQLGRLYLKKGALEDALFAYIEASAADNDVIKEEAYYQSAQIHTKLENYSEAIQYASDYLDQFNSGQWKVEMQNLIAQSYLRTSNYDLAIEHLQSSGINTSTQKEVYQVVTFQKALLLFNDAAFDLSKKWFLESLKHPEDIMLTNRSYYHLGEISLRVGAYKQALNHYQKQTLIDPLSHYGIGYAYYNQQQYEAAISHFRNARNATEKEIQQDAAVRLADCLFATKSYDQAASIYQNLQNQLNSPYVTFQLGKTYRNLGNDDQAIRAFRTIFSSTRYGALARFESGMVFFEAAKFSEAIENFSQVINRFPDSPSVLESILNRGISYKNLGELGEAKNEYLSILNKYPTEEIALNAILGLQELQQAGIEVGNLESFIDTYKKANPNSGSLEVIEFEASKRQYFDFAYDQAVKSFEKFLKNYPSSSNNLEAKYYLADAYYRLEKYQESERVFNELKYVRNAFTGRILNRLGDINRQLSDVSESEEAFKLLLDLDLNPKDTYNARRGLMSLYYENDRYQDAINQSDEIIQSTWKPLNAEQEARLVKANSLMKLGNVDSALEQFQMLAEGKDVFAVEAGYNIGLIQYNEGKHEESLNTLFDLNAAYGSYQDWIDRSYLLIARNYITMEELFQAKATLRSIIQHAKNEEVKSEADTLLNQIEQDTIDSDTITKNEE